MNADAKKPSAVRPSNPAVSARSSRSSIVSASSDEMPAIGAPMAAVTATTLSITGGPYDGEQPGAAGGGFGRFVSTIEHPTSDVDATSAVNTRETIRMATLGEHRLPASATGCPHECLTRMMWQSMITSAAIRKLALGFPEAIESSHFDVVDFRVRKKIFATIHPSGKTGVLLHIDPDQRAALAATDPDTYQLRGTALQVVFAKVSAAAYKELITQAWCGTAPKRLVAAYQR